jgi:hypothetical protein
MPIMFYKAVFDEDYSSTKVLSKKLISLTVSSYSNYYYSRLAFLARLMLHIWSPYRNTTLRASIIGMSQHAISLKISLNLTWKREREK